jgi:hypothetical protein
MNVRFILRILVLLLLALPLPAIAARFSVHHASLDGGGGVAFGGRFAVASALASGIESGHVSLVNAPPSAGRDIFVLPPVGPAVISVSNLLGNDFDMDGNAPAFALPETNTTEGGSITLLNGTITYTPPSNLPPRGDSFSYIVTNHYGLASIARVVLASPAAAPRLVDLRRTETNLNVRFQTLPDQTYIIQFRSRLIPGSSWLDYPSSVKPLTLRSDAAGIFQFTIPVGRSNDAFFRAADVQSLREQLATRRDGNQILMSLRGTPNAIYKLQFRNTFNPPDSWGDYPSSSQPFTVVASSDGFYELAAPILPQTGFYRTVPRIR